MMILSGEYSAIFLADIFYDLDVLCKEVVAAHAGFARKAACYDYDIAVCGFFPVAGADDVGIIKLKRSRLGDIKSLAFGEAFNYIEQNDVTELPGCGDVSGGCADVTGTNYCYFIPCHKNSFNQILLVAECVTEYVIRRAELRLRHLWI